MNKRWNGWGYHTVDYPLKPEGLALLEERIGAGTPRPDVPLESIAARVPDSRLRPHPLISTDAAERITHSMGHSLPDWIAMRGGRYPAFVDGVAYPTGSDDVRQLIAYARDSGARLIPFGGGTSVVGHLTPQSDAPTLSVDMRRMSALRDFDAQSQLATFEAGAAGPDIEAQLRARGCTLGHYPQSFEFSTVGGWIATRSSGQQSRFYGRIEGMFAGGTVETPAGTLEIPAYPASAAGVDLREAVMGSEGRMGIITRAVMRVTQAPQAELFAGIMFPNFEQGMAAVREIAQAQIPVSMLRLSSPAETHTTLTLAGHKRAIHMLERYLTWRGASDEKCMLIYGVTGSKRIVTAARKAVKAIAAAHHGVNVGKVMGDAWRKNRFRGAYLRNTLWDAGYAVDTVETAVSWSGIEAAIQRIESGVHEAIARFDECAHVFTHLSHVYPTGSSVYTTILFRLGATPEDTFARWQASKSAASEAIIASGGTISHQHGVGTDHAAYLLREKGRVALDAVDALMQSFDPDGLMMRGAQRESEARR